MKDTYLFLAAGVSAAGNDLYPPGERHALLLFALGESLEDAEHVAVAHIASQNWSNVQIQRRDRVKKDALKSMTPDASDMYWHAQEHGASALVFSSPIAGT